MSNERQKAKDLVELACDDGTNEKERLAAAINAIKLIRKYGLLDSPFDGILESNNEGIKAAATVLERLSDPELVGSLKKVLGVAGGLAKRRRGR